MLAADISAGAIQPRFEAVRRSGTRGNADGVCAIRSPFVGLAPTTVQAISNSWSARGFTGNSSPSRPVVPALPLHWRGPARPRIRR